MGLPYTVNTPILPLARGLLHSWRLVCIIYSVMHPCLLDAALSYGAAESREFDPRGFDYTETGRTKTLTKWSGDTKLTIGRNAILELSVF